MTPIILQFRSVAVVIEMARPRIRRASPRNSPLDKYNNNNISLISLAVSCRQMPRSETAGDNLMNLNLIYGHNAVGCDDVVTANCISSDSKRSGFRFPELPLLNRCDKFYFNLSLLLI